MPLLLALLLACAGPVRPVADAATGEVEVRVVGMAATTAGTRCGEPTGAAVWTDAEGGPSRPGHGVITWGSCGPRPALAVLPAGSTVVLRNEGSAHLDLRWAQEGGAGEATLAPGGERRVVLGAQGALEVESERGAASVVVARRGGVADGEGRVWLTDVPAGEQVLTVMHPAGGRRRTAVNVPEGDRVVVEVQLPGPL